MLHSRRKLPPLNALRAFEVSGRRLSFRAAAGNWASRKAPSRSRFARWRISLASPCFSATRAALP